MRRHRSWMALGWMASSRPLISSACRLLSPCDKIKPEFKQNPQSRQRYRRTLAIANAPGAFKSVEGFMQFDFGHRHACRIPNAPYRGVSAMRTILTLLLPAFFLLLASCGCRGDHMETIYSPDKKYKAVIQQSEGSPGRCFTAVDVLRASTSRTDAAFDPIAGFEAPHDYTQLNIRWISNDTLQASYPGFPPGEFPRRSYNYENEVKFDFPK